VHQQKSEVDNRDKKQKSEKIIILLIILWIFFAFLLIWFDLEISLVLVDQNSSWASFLAVYGEVPGYFVILFALLILIHAVNHSNNFIYFSVLVLIFLFQVIFFGVIVLILSLDNVFPQEYDFLLIPAIICFLFLINLSLKRFNFKNNSQLKLFAKITLLLAIINPLFFVQIFKNIWGRTRFRDLNPDFSDFTSWPVPQGITGDRSFPSGHSAMGWMLLPLILLVNSSSNPKLKFVLTVFIGFWGIIVSVSRIVIGAHYASDVLFSSMVGLITFILLTRRFFLIREDQVN
jgi:membrane-associated phospholipid phosphatase